MSAVAKSKKQKVVQRQQPVERYSLPAPQQMLGPIPKAPSQDVVPLPGETQSMFFDRANNALEQQYVETIPRTVAILRLWQQSPNDANLREKAQARFTADKFTHCGPRCIFLSHTIPEIAEERDVNNEITRPGREGTQYNRENLQKLVDYANYRILNADQFAALSEGHMPTMQEKATGRPDAEVLGYAGPFYIGLFGNVDPQWSIWADEWVHNEDMGRAQKLQRRSPEVWCKEPIERRTMDPIAMLGSETPRLDSGMNLYSLRSDGQMVMRYSMGMALAGPDNAFIPGSESGKKQNYGASDMAFPPSKEAPKPPDANAQKTPPAAPPMPNAGADNSDQTTSPAPGGIDVDGLVQQAIADLMPSIVQAVTDFLTAQDPNSNDAVPQAEQDDPGEDEIPRGIDAPEDADATPQQPPASANQAAAQPNQMQAPDPMQARQPSAAPSPANPQAPATAIVDPTAGPAQPTPAAPMPQQPIDEKHQQYMGMSPDCGEAYAAGHASCEAKMKGQPPMSTATAPAPDKYSKQFEDQNSVITKLNERIAAQEKLIQTLVQDKTDTERYSKIHSILRDKELPEGVTEKEIVAEAFQMGDEEFDRYSKTLGYMPKKPDPIETELYDDPNFGKDERDLYSRSGGTGSGNKMRPADAEKLKRLAQDLAVKINAKSGKGTTSFDEQWELQCKAHGFVA